LLNQVPLKVKKFVQERDKEMFNVQRAFLNATGPLCGLHDCIENDSAPTYEEIKVPLEQALPCRLSQCSAVYPEMTESPCCHKLFEDEPRGTTSA